MKGNIKNKLRERYNYEINENFEVKISEGEQKYFSGGKNYGQTSKTT